MWDVELNESFSLHPEGRRRAARSRLRRRVALTTGALLAIIGVVVAGEGAWTGPLIEWLGGVPPAGNGPNPTPSEHDLGKIADAMARTSPLIVPGAGRSTDPVPEAKVETVQHSAGPDTPGSPNPGGSVGGGEGKGRGQQARVEHSPASEPDRPAPDDPEDVLRRHGLNRSGMYYLVAEETDVRARRKELWGAYARLYNAAGRRAEIDCVDKMILALQENRDWLSFDVADMQNQLCGFRALRNSIDRAEYSNLRNARTLSQADLINKDRALKSLRDSSPTPAQRQSVSYEFDSALGAWQESVRQLRRSVDSLNEEYARLREEPGVREALAALGRARHVPQKLGSEEFRDAEKELRRVERILGAG